MIPVAYSLIHLGMAVAGLCFLTDFVFLARLPDRAEGTPEEELPFFLSGVFEFLAATIATIAGLFSFGLAIAAVADSNECKDFEVVQCRQSDMV